MISEQNLEKLNPRMNVEFCPASLEGLSRLTSMVRAFYEYDGHNFDEVQIQETVSHLIADPTLGFIRLVSVDSAIHGYYIVCFGFSVEHGGREAFIDELYLDEEVRGFGIGRMIIRDVEERCRAAKVKMLHLEVQRENVPAQKFYHSLGFEDHERYLLSKQLR